MEDKVCVLTGASAGLGAGIAESLCKAGFKNLVLVARRQEKLQDVAEKCKTLGAKEVLCLPKDLANLETCPEVIQATVDKFGRLDVLINNAGVLIRSNTADMDIKEFQRVMNLNVMSSFALTKGALPHLRKVKGNIVFISSIAGQKPGHGLSAYSCSKAALTMFAKVVALEEAANGVRANVVSPGGVATEMIQTFLDPKMSMDEVGKIVTDANPLKYSPTSADVANAVLYFVRDDTGGYCTGTELVVDGGTLLTSEISNH